MRTSLPEACWMFAGGTQGFERKTFAVRRMRGWAPGEMSTRFTARRTHFLAATYSGKDTNSRTRVPVVDMTSMSVGANRASSRRWSGRMTRPTSCRAPVAGSTTSSRVPSAPPPSRIRPSRRAADVGPRVPPAGVPHDGAGDRDPGDLRPRRPCWPGRSAARRPARITAAAATVAVPVAIDERGQQEADHAREGNGDPRRGSTTLRRDALSFRARWANDVPPTSTPAPTASSRPAGAGR